MKKELVLIRPIYPEYVNVKGPRRLICQTRIGNTYFVLTDRWRMMPLNEFAALTDKSEKIKEIQFTPTNKEFRIEFFLKDPERLQPEEADKKWDIARIGEWQRAKDLEDRVIMENAAIRTAVFHFFGRHEQIKQLQPFGNAHVPSSEEFEIDFISQKGRIYNLIDRKRIKAANLINEMSVSELIDCAMFYAPHLHGRRPSEIRNGLVGLRGISMGTKEANGQNIAEPCGVLMSEPNLTDFLERYKPNGSNAVKIYVNKGIELKIISKTSTGYYINDGATCVGNEPDDVIQYMTRNVDEYLNWLQPQVNKLENLPEDDCEQWDVADVASIMESTASRKKKHENLVMGSKNARQLREEEASRLGVKYANRLDDKKLDEAILDAQMKLTKDQQSAGAPTITNAKVVGAAQK